MDSAEPDVLYPDAIYPALEKPATELERLVVEYLNATIEGWTDVRIDKVRQEARARRLIP